MPPLDWRWVSVFLVALVGVSACGGVSRLDGQGPGADVGGVAGLSPFFLFDRSTPLLTGGETFDAGAVLALGVTAAALCAFAAVAFARRDLGGAVIRVRAATTRPTMRPATDPLLRLPVLAIVDQQRLWTIGWAAALCTLAYFLISLTRTMLDSLAAIPSMQAYFTDRMVMQRGASGREIGSGATI